MNLGSIPPEVLALALALALAIALIHAVALAAGRRLRRRRMRLRMKRAVAGEARAPALLAEYGYTVVGAQVVVEHAVRVDDREVRVELRADYLADKHGARYVVEVKTGALAPRIETRATRRQLLEYRIAFDVAGVVLVDAESGRVHEVTFPALGRFAHPTSSGWRVMAVAVVLVAALVGAAVVTRAGATGVENACSAWRVRCTQNEPSRRWPNLRSFIRDAPSFAACSLGSEGGDSKHLPRWGQRRGSGDSVK